MSTTIDPLGVGRDAHHTAVVFCMVDARTFAHFFDVARVTSEQVRAATSVFDFYSDDETAYVLTTDARSGYAVRSDGELVYVFSTVKGRGDAIVEKAIYSGAVYLDCFDGYLVELYARHGFRKDAWVPNWTDGQPDVVYMSLPGYADRHGVKVTTRCNHCDGPNH